jgi:hypothetical protein
MQTKYEISKWKKVDRLSLVRNFVMKSTTVILVFALFLSVVFAQNPTPIAWPNAWNASILVTVNDIVVGAPAMVYYDNSQNYQRVDFSQCAIAGGPVNNDPCTLIFSSNIGNFGVSDFSLSFSMFFAVSDVVD